MYENRYDCPSEIRAAHQNFVASVVRDKYDRWTAVLPNFDEAGETAVIVPEKTADLIVTNWKERVPVCLKFIPGVTKGHLIQAYNYSLQVFKL